MANKSKYPLYCFISFEDESDWDDKDKLLAVVFGYIRKLDRGLAWLLVKDVDRHCGEGEDDNRLTCTAHCAVYQLELEVDRLRETMVFSVRPHNGKPVMRRKRLDLIDIDYGERVLSRTIELAHPGSLDMIKEVIREFLRLDPKSGWPRCRHGELVS
jgi:hypothetical protein